MKKRITAIALATLMCVGVLAGCGKKDEPVSEPEASQDSGTDLDAILDEAENAQKEAAQAEAEDNGEPDLPHYECTDLVLNADPGDGYIQIADMVFQLGGVMTPDDVRKVVEASSTGLQCVDVVEYEGMAAEFIGVDIADADGNPVFVLSYTPYHPDENYGDAIIKREDITEPIGFLYKINGVYEMSRDWIDYHSVYTAGGIENSLINDMSYSADLSAFPYKTKDEYIEHLRSIGFLSYDEVKAKEAETGTADQQQGFYRLNEDKPGFLSVCYPATDTSNSIFVYKATVYNFDWGIHADDLTKIELFGTNQAGL